MTLHLARLRLLSQLESLGTVRAVAEANHLSPSSVSQQLAVLETETRTTLLERSGRRVRLTSTALVLVSRARSLLDLADAVEAELAGLTAEPVGTVRLAAFPSVLRTLVIPTIGLLAQRHPDLVVELHEQEPPVSLPALRRGELDVAVVAELADGSTALAADVPQVPLTHDEVVVVLPPDHPAAAGTGPVDLAALAGSPWALDLPDAYLSGLALRLCRAAGFEPRVVGRFAGHDTLLQHVAAGLSVTVLPERAVDGRDDVRTRPLPDPVVRRISAAVRSTAVPRAAVTATLAALRSVAARRDG